MFALCPFGPDGESLVLPTDEWHTRGCAYIRVARKVSTALPLPHHLHIELTSTMETSYSESDIAPRTPPRESQSVSFAEEALPRPTPGRPRHTGSQATNWTPAISEISHTLPMVNPHLKVHLDKSTKAIPIRQWISVALGLPSERFDIWMREIKGQRWAHDPAVKSALRAYCEASGERERYAPFTELGNQLIDMARGRLTGIAKADSYPIDDISFFVTSEKGPSKNPEHRKAGAVRKPDVVMARSRAHESGDNKTNGTHAMNGGDSEKGNQQKKAKDRKSAQSHKASTERRSWSELLQCFEFKKGSSTVLAAYLRKVSSKTPSPSHIAQAVQVCDQSTCT